MNSFDFKTCVLIYVDTDEWLKFGFRLIYKNDFIRLSTKIFVWIVGSSLVTPEEFQFYGLNRMFNLKKLWD